MTGNLAQIMSDHHPRRPFPDDVDGSPGGVSPASMPTSALRTQPIWAPDGDAHVFPSPSPPRPAQHTGHEVGSRSWPVARSPASNSSPLSQTAVAEMQLLLGQARHRR